VEAGRNEIVELHLRDRPLPGNGCAHGDSEDGVLGDRRIDDAVAKLLEQRTKKQERSSVEPSDILAVDEHTPIGTKRIADPCHHRFEERRALLVKRETAIDRWQIWIEIDIQTSGRLERLDVDAWRLVGRYSNPRFGRLRPGRLDNRARFLFN